MYAGGDAAEQIVRMSMQGIEVTAKITGSAAKNIAILMYAILRQEKKTKGKKLLTNMLRSGKELTVFTVRKADLKEFTRNAKSYGVQYCVVKDRRNKDADAQVDVIVRTEDAGKINRIVEKFNLASIDTASIVTEIEKEKSGMKGSELQVTDEAADALTAELMGTPVNNEEIPLNPQQAKTEKSPPSEPISEPQEHITEGTTNEPNRKSIKKELKKIKEQRKKTDNPKDRKENVRSQDNRSTQSGTQIRKPKKKNRKER